MRAVGLRLTAAIFILATGLVSSDLRIRVTVDMAAIHAEAHESSYLIEKVPRGTVLTLYQPGKIDSSWYYVRFQSQRYRGPVTGFIRADHAEPFDENSPPLADLPISESRTEPSDPQVSKPPQQPPAIEIEAEAVRPPDGRVIAPSIERHRPSARTWRHVSAPVLTATPLPPGGFDRAYPAASSGSGLRARPWPLSSDSAPEPETPPIPEEARPTALGEGMLAEGIRMSRDPESLVFDLNPGPFSSFRHFTMREPSRVILDLEGSRGFASSRRFLLEDEDLEALRVGQFKDDVSRAVFDLKGPLLNYSIERTGDGLRIVFTRAGTEEEPPQPPVITHRLETIPTPAGRPAVTAPPGRMPEASGARFKPTAPLPLPPPEISLGDTPLPRGTSPAPLPRDHEPAAAIWKSPPPKPPPLPEQVLQPRPGPPSSPSPPGLRGLFSVGLGYGASLGGLGGFFQLNHPSGFALHAGLGAFPTRMIYSDSDWVENRMLYSFGAKYYLPLRSRRLHPYVDLQYGGLKVEAVQVIVQIWEATFHYLYEQKTLYGPSLMGGFEFRAGPVSLNAAAGLSYVLTDWEWLGNRLAFALDTGLVFHF